QQNRRPHPRTLSPYTPLFRSSSPAVADKDHPAHPHDKFKFADDADDDSAHPGNAKGKDKDISAQASDVSEDQFKTKLDDHHASDDPKIDDTDKDDDKVKLADDNSVHPGNAKGEDKDISAQSSDVSEDQFKTKLDDHHASADPKIDDIAKGHDNFKFADD